MSSAKGKRGPGPNVYSDIESELLQLQPTEEEMASKEKFRQELDEVIRTSGPLKDSELFSIANGFSLRDSDLDLCCLAGSDKLTSSVFATILKIVLLWDKTKYSDVVDHSNALVPVIKCSARASGIKCNISLNIKNSKLALRNTRLLWSYAQLDQRCRTLGLFIKHWSKQRKINSPNEGTLSSYGYVLLVIYFLVHGTKPPVLPNLQNPPWPHTPKKEIIDGHNVWFFDDTQQALKEWKSENKEDVVELLKGFFRYFQRNGRDDFLYDTQVASIRSGPLRQSDSHMPRVPLENACFCIEDPFETNVNVARSVTKNGLEIMQGEFMKALRKILNGKHRRGGKVSLLKLYAELETSSNPAHTTLSSEVSSAPKPSSTTAPKPMSSADPSSLPPRPDRAVALGPTLKSSSATTPKSLNPAASPYVPQHPERSYEPGVATPDLKPSSTTAPKRTASSYGPPGVAISSSLPPRPDWAVGLGPTLKSSSATTPKPLNPATSPYVPSRSQTVDYWS